MERPFRKTVALWIGAGIVGAVALGAQLRLTTEAARYLLADGVNQGRVHALRLGRSDGDPITMQLGVGLSKGLVEWIQATWGGRAVRKSGEIVAVDRELKVLSATAFQEALLTEVAFPALDGSSKDPGYLGVRIAPERSYQKSLEEMSTLRVSREPTWISNSFRVAVGSLPCRRVSKVDGITFKAAGSAERATPSSFAVTLPAADSPAWSEWFQDFVVRGHNGAEDELTGSIVFLAQDMSTVLLRVTLLGVGIVKLERQDDVRQVVAHLYARGMRLGR